MIILATVLLCSQSYATQHRYVEDFRSKQYCDEANTTALWDTLGGALTLHPFLMSIKGNYNSPAYTWAVAYSGNYAFLADNNGIMVVSIADKLHPAFRAWCDCTGPACNIVVSGDYAYVAVGTSGLDIIDISNPGAPTRISNCNTAGTAIGVVLDGYYAYVADLTGGLAIIDVHNPGSPQLLTQYPLEYAIYGVTVKGDCAYVAAYDGGLYTIDITNPAGPAVLGSCDAPISARNIAVSGKYAYVADDVAGLRIIDISNPAAPTLASTYENLYKAIDVAVCGNYAYVADYWGGMHAIDIRDPLNPTEAGILDTPGLAMGIELMGTWAIVADYDQGIQIVEIASSISHPINMASIYSGSADNYDIAIDGDYAYEASNVLKIYDIGNPYSPQLLSTTPLYSSATDIDIRGKYAFVMTWYPGCLKIFDISSPATPTLIGSHYTTLGSHGWKFAIYGDLAYISCSNGIEIVSISDVSNPSLLSTCTTISTVGDIIIEGTKAYLESYSGLFIMDISDPLAPLLLGSCSVVSSSSLAIHGDYAYVTVSSPNIAIKVIDISNAAAPMLIRDVILQEYGGMCFLKRDGCHLYAVGHFPELVAIDIGDPANPQVRGRGECAVDAVGLAIEGDYCYVRAESSIEILKVLERGQLLESKNRAQSLPFPQILENMQRIRIISSQADSIAWRASADGGSNWVSLVPSDAWTVVNSPGNRLLWQADLFCIQEGIIPACSQMSIEWLIESAMIDSIVDVKNDQGGFVRIAWSRSSHDFSSDPNEIYGYEIYKLDDLENAILTATVPAHCEEYYSCMVPTESDWTPEKGAPYERYFVRAIGVTPDIYFDSPPDSGYSIDNLYPHVPEGINGEQSAEGLLITWKPNTEADLDHYSLYRGCDPGFIPDAGNLVGIPVAPSFLDKDWHQGSLSHYKISAIDRSGNESPFALLAPDKIVAAELRSYLISVEEGCIEVNWILAYASSDYSFSIVRKRDDNEISLGSQDVQAGSNGLSFWFRDCNCEPDVKYSYCVSIVDEAGQRVLFETETVALPKKKLALYQNHPNPFNPSTSIRYYLPSPASVTVEVYDIAGKKIMELMRGNQETGLHSIDWHGTNSNGYAVPSGIYFYRLSSGKTSLSKKMVLIR